MVKHRTSARLLCLSFTLLLASACGFLKKEDKNPLAGSGVKAMEPYQGRASGAVRMGLQMFNGCGWNPNGAPSARGTGSFQYPYPATCTDLLDRPVTRPMPPMPVVAGTKYFLDQITLVDSILGAHTDPDKLDQPVAWFKTQTHFKNLDWTNLGVEQETWDSDRAGTVNGYTHEIRFANAKWMMVKDDTFKLEILDSDGKVVASQTYPRRMFLLENPFGGHTKFAWRVGIVGKPEFPGDRRINAPGPQPSGSPPVSPPQFQTFARFEAMANMNPFETTFTIPESLTGDGAARLTWSQLPDEPFYFPLTFKHSTDADFPQCWKADDPTKKVPCDFGSDPKAIFSAPMNGKYYEPGEKFELTVQMRDGAGNLLHPPDRLPSYNDYLAGKSNGLLYLNNDNIALYGEVNVISMIMGVGPLQLMRPYYGLSEDPPGPFPYNPIEFFLPSFPADVNIFPEAREAPGPTHFPVQVPADAVPGTYLFFVKQNRQFMGERHTRSNSFYYQVGQAEKTSYPQRIGNCQICHRGASDLSNLAMGVAVQDVEACKACHHMASTRDTHLIHMYSDKFPMQKNECTNCHLTHEAPLRASLYTCTACHMQAHGNAFPYSTPFTSRYVNYDPGPGASCALTCHQLTPPTQHLIPPK